jgi:hypothetical protein
LIRLCRASCSFPVAFRRHPWKFHYCAAWNGAYLSTESFEFVWCKLLAFGWVVLVVLGQCCGPPGVFRGCLSLYLPQVRTFLMRLVIPALRCPWLSNRRVHGQRRPTCPSVVLRAEPLGCCQRWRTSLKHYVCHDMRLCVMWVAHGNRRQWRNSASQSFMPCAHPGLACGITWNGALCLAIIVFCREFQRCMRASAAWSRISS